MILLGSSLQRASAVSIQTGGVIGTTSRPIIDPAKLTIIAYEITGAITGQQPSYILTQDIRELSDMGLIVDSADELVAPGDVVALDTILSLRFTLVGMRVQDERGKKLGKVGDFTIDVASYYIQQLVVKRPLMSSLTDTELIIHRTQIIEINNEAIVVHSEAKAPEPERAEVTGSYINPFRKPTEAASESNALPN